MVVHTDWYRKLEQRAIVASDIRSLAARKRNPQARIPALESICRMVKIEKPIIATEKSCRRRRPRFRKRKPYQVALTVTESNGYTFKRVRGWRQPVQTSMMIKNRVKKLQSWLDEQQRCQSHLEMMRHERQFLSELGVQEDIHEYGKCQGKSYLLVQHLTR